MNFRASPSCSPDGCVLIYAIPSGRLEKKLDAFAGGLVALTKSADGRLLYAASVTGEAQVYDLVEQQVKHRFLLGAGFCGLWPTALELAGAEFSCDGKRILTRSALGPVQLWDVETGLPLRSFPVCGADAAAFMGRRHVRVQRYHKEREEVFFDVLTGAQMGPDFIAKHIGSDPPDDGPVLASAFSFQKTELLQRPDGETLFTFPGCAEFAGVRRDRVLSVEDRRHEIFGFLNPSRRESLVIWQRRHGERWWGHLTRPECILMVVIAAVWCWLWCRNARGISLKRQKRGSQCGKVEVHGVQNTCGPS